MLLASSPDFIFYKDAAGWAISLAVAILGIVGVLLGIILRNQHRTRNTANATLHQVKNSHEVNLRDDLDEKFGNLFKDIGGLRADLRLIGDAAIGDRKFARDTEERLTALERTRPPIRKPAARKRSYKPKEQK